MTTSEALERLLASVADAEPIVDNVEGNCMFTLTVELDESTVQPCLTEGSNTRRSGMNIEQALLAIERYNMSVDAYTFAVFSCNRQHAQFMDSGNGILEELPKAVEALLERVKGTGDTDTDDVFLWPSGSWCYRYEAEGYMRDGGVGDDYEVIGFNTPEYADFFNRRV